MVNTFKIGYVYHVVDKTTGEVVKVGSTIRTLNKRFGCSDYRKKYTNHFIREARVIKSSDIDWYDPKDFQCPFIWHLLAAEHLEMLKMDTYRKSPLSNKSSPLDQKVLGFDSSKSSIGGKIAGLMNVESGHLVRMRGLPKTKKAQSENCRSLEERGVGIFAPGMMAKGGFIAGQIAVKSGQLASLRTSEHQSSAGKMGGKRSTHNKWHVNRGIVSPTCELCKQL